ncbi:PREDICTED: myotrophin-like [Priapulus caudatus]|uniref:Myotrophin-like n=1 Tax=Priapulus caudatus TaxID=37621 RepID=A0ABM1E1M7_PRICU|nr:PREDICTED: myotrophin-like [Priapulus caudatus]
MGDFVWALKNGDMEKVKELVENQKVNVKEEISGRPPIHYAADYGQKDVIKYLLEAGADVNSIDKHGISALLAAIWEGHTDCVKFMLEKGARKEGAAPDGTSYLDCAEKQVIKALLK